MQVTWKKTSEPQPFDKISMSEGTAEADESGGHALRVEFYGSLNNFDCRKMRYNCYSELMQLLATEMTPFTISLCLTSL